MGREWEEEEEEGRRRRRRGEVDPVAIRVEMWQFSTKVSHADTTLLRHPSVRTLTLHCLRKAMVSIQDSRGTGVVKRRQSSS